jgi:uncharacterized NAD(P)/FAD-binding protein YdhS
MILLTNNDISIIRQQLYDKQNGICFLCSHKIKNPVLDHNHKTGIVRGCICAGCNRILGKIENNYRRYNITDQQLKIISPRVYDYIQKERIANRLEILAGKVLDLKLNEKGVQAKIYDKKQKIELTCQFTQVINCTGPETKIEKSGNELLLQLKQGGFIVQDDLQLGIEVNDSYQIINSQNQVDEKMFAIGGLLKGKLWESTAINELRVQAKKVSILINS